MPRPIQEQIEHRVAETPDQPYLFQPIDRTWWQWTWADAVDEARRFAQALDRLGIEPGDRVALISKNCAHWVLADIAMLLSKIVSVPIYPTANAGTIEKVLRHSGAKACIVGKLEDAERQLDGIPEGMTTIALPYPGARGNYDWEDLIAEGDGQFPTRRAGEDEVATLLYTSGSTGDPKGAIHTYSSFAFVGASLSGAIGVRAGDRIFSYLPLAHCTERAYVEAGSFYGLTSLYFAESLDTFMDDLQHARPTLFGSVPRLWKKFQLGVLESVPQKRLDTLLRIPVIAWLIRRKIKRKLGLDEATWFASGAAPIAPALLEWWSRLGVPISEGWGMTETFAYGTQIGRGEKPKFGTISRALPEAEIRIVDEELRIRCPSLMKGYYKQPELGEETFDDEGFLKTGDRASIDEDGWVTITGRVKELFKTTKGKYVAPVPIESRLAKNAMIEQACVIGEGMDQPIALVQLADTEGSSMREVRRRLKETLDSVNEELESHERLARVIVVREEWTIENGLLTPTMKIKRPEIESRYRDLVEESDGKVYVQGRGRTGDDSDG